MPVNLGVSQLSGRTFGKMQVMTNVQAAYNLLAAVHELERDYGEIVTFNEGDRSRDDQWSLRVAYINFLNGGPWAALAAWCTWGPPAQFTSTHDEINYGNAADLGGPGGAVISDRARNLLDGSHPDGVLGRKYGIFNTGWNFARREIWHFNIYPARAQVLAPAPFASTDKPAPEPEKIPVVREEDDMKVMGSDKFAFAKDGPRLWKIDAVKVNGKTYPASTVKGILERVEKSTPEKPAQFTDTEFNVLRAVLKRFK